MRISMTRYGEQGWQFSVGDVEYRTNRQGNGLWAYERTSATNVHSDGTESPVYEFRQVAGTAQFALSADRKRAYGQIRYRWIPREN